MGNRRSLPRQKFRSQFLPEEQAEIDRLFDALSSSRDSPATSPRSFSLNALKSHVGDALPPGMVARLYGGLQGGLAGSKGAPGEGVSQEQLTVSLSHLLKGNAEEKSLVILRMISATGGPVKAGEVKQFTEDLAGSVVHVLAHRQELRGWSPKKGPGPPARVQELAAQLLSEMKLPDSGSLLGPQWLDQVCDPATLEDWVFRVPQVAAFLSVVLCRGLPIQGCTPHPASLVPECHAGLGPEIESILDVLAVLYLSGHLAREQQQRWRLLFSSQRHGHSFSQLCGRILHQGPCLALVEDLDGHVFGGFSSCSWEVTPRFQGDNRCFLFSLSPRMAVYTHTGYNDHFMYLNHGQQTMPNGLGMGGQHNYFGLWVDADFGRGHSRAKPTCTTYGSPQLSAQEDFRIARMEVWAVGEPPERERTKSKGILDVDPEARALLEISGRPRHSEGFREAPEDSH